MTIWDKLSARSPACVIHVTLMRSQHRRVGELLNDLKGRIPKWRATARAEDTDAVARAITAANEVLFDHLGQEEAKILPVIAYSWSQEEWDAVGKQAGKGIPRASFTVLIGSMLQALPEAARDAALKKAPAIARLIYRFSGRRRFDAYRRQVYGLAA